MSRESDKAQADAVLAHGKCRSCGAAIAWLLSAAGNKMPVDYTGVVPGDVVFDHKRHVSHFATCPDAAKWRQR